MLGGTFPGRASLVPLEDAQLVAEEMGRLRPGVGDQRLRLGQFQLESLAQECLQLGFDRLRFGPRSGEVQQEIVGLCRVSGYADRGG